MVDWFLQLVKHDNYYKIFESFLNKLFIVTIDTALCAWSKGEAGPRERFCYVNQLYSHVTLKNAFPDL